MRWWRWTAPIVGPGACGARATRWTPRRRRGRCWPERRAGACRAQKPRIGPVTRSFLRVRSTCSASAATISLAHLGDLPRGAYHWVSLSPRAMGSSTIRDMLAETPGNRTIVGLAPGETASRAWWRPLTTCGHGASGSLSTTWGASRPLFRTSTVSSPRSSGWTPARSAESMPIRATGSGLVPGAVGLRSRCGDPRPGDRDPRDPEPPSRPRRGVWTGTCAGPAAQLR
jgi:hypothetical protein